MSVRRVLNLNGAPERLGELLIDGISDIDKRCCKIIDGVECGLVYIREQFAADALRATGKKLTEELLMSWLLRDRLRETGISAELEAPYEGSKRQSCDLVLQVSDKVAFAVEVKVGVGFDSFDAPMDDRIAELERSKNLHRRNWQQVAQRAWPDRRNASYRIACWFWARPPCS